MPVASLTFDLPDENEEFLAAMNGANAIRAIREIADLFRQKIKYQDLSKEERILAERLRGEFFEVLSNNSITLD